MVLNYIWIAFFLIAFVVAVGETVFNGNLDVWSEIMNSSFGAAETAFTISLGLTGILSLWMGLMKIGEQGGVIQFFGRLVSPLFSRLFPGIPKNHPAMGSIFMNVSANMLGLDYAATPLGLKAMNELQQLNPKKDTAQCIRAVHDSNRCDDVSGSMWRDKSHRCVYAYSGGHFHCHSGGNHSSVHPSAHQFP